jgi:ABC-type polysaccharide/polyol phosphate transport system ATPase subunit
MNGSAEPVIRARDLRKVYRLYTGQGYKFLDMFGLLRRNGGAYTEHAALDGVTLDVRRGEKVAFIGRNGAGKSTLLKLVTRVIEPTSGTLDVHGKVHALLQIGTGFHPDFTGRENVYAYLAQLGIMGGEADRRFTDILEFAELEEYIGQPVKTYSTGMAVRLMFSTATAITPELLVLDEVLGVGDAYFAQKSYERMRELCEDAGTTLLLVTHDIYAAARMCDRIVWIDRGRILMDGQGPRVIKAYEDSIRQQEESRLRVRKQLRLETTAHMVPVILELHSAENRPLASPVYFSRIDVIAGSSRTSFPLGDDAFDEASPTHLQREGASWGAAVMHEQRPARALVNDQSPYHKVTGVTLIRASDVVGALSAEIEYWSCEPFTLSVRAFIGDRILIFEPFRGETGRWAEWSGTASVAQSADRHVEINTSGVHGTGAITLLDIKAIDAVGNEAHFFSHDEPFELVLKCRIHRDDLHERPQILVAFHRDGVQDVCRIITRDLVFDAELWRDGEIRLRVPHLRLGSGTYTVTVMVAREGYYDEEQTRYFSLNPGVYACHSRALEIVVTGGGAVASGTAIVADGEWRICPQ